MGNRIIGEKHPTYIIAEIGLNHQGDVSLAKKSDSLDELSIEERLKARKEAHMSNLKKTEKPVVILGSEKIAATVEKAKKMVEAKPEPIKAPLIKPLPKSEKKAIQPAKKIKPPKAETAIDEKKRLADLDKKLANILNE